MTKSESVFSKPVEYQHVEPEISVSHEGFEAVVKRRRSVRVYENTPVPENVIRQALEMAILAPTSSNLQCWEFYWVRDKVKKQKVVEACLSQPAARTAQELIVAVARTKSWRRNARWMSELFNITTPAVPQSAKDYYSKLVPIVYGQGPFGVGGILKKITVNIVGLFRPIPREPTSLSDVRVWAHKTTALACENFMLSIAASGFDTCPMEGMDSSRIKKCLSLAKDAEVCMVISVGKRSPKGIYGPRIRFDNKHFIFEV